LSQTLERCRVARSEMKVKHLYISGYKNLKEFALDFEGDAFLEIFVGKNGSGKSNFFEATAEIFRHLFELDHGGVSPSFDYRVHYELGGEDVEIKWTSGKLWVNGGEATTLETVPRPDHIILYYSGHNPTIDEIAQVYHTQFRGRLSAPKASEVRRFVTIDATYKDLLLSLMLIQPPESPARTYALERLGIASTGTELHLVLNRPLYARQRRSGGSSVGKIKPYWKVSRDTKKFLERLNQCISPASAGPVRAEGYFADQDQYIHHLNLEAFAREFAGETPQWVFRAFDHLKALDMLGGISLDLTLHDGTVARVRDFSDGQFQSLYIYAVAEFFKDRHYLALLDEPDSFLHPEWQFSFLNQMTEISMSALRGGQIFMTSHSAVTLIPYEKVNVQFFETRNLRSTCHRVPKHLAVKRLSDDILKYSEREDLLSIINTIRIEHKPVLFTEGSTDLLILKAAWQKLYDDDMPFIPCYAFSCTYIKQLLTDDRIHAEMGSLPIFALFDFDKAYDQWNGLKGEKIVTDPDLGLVKKWSGGESYAIMLPTPSNPMIRQQVINDETNKVTFEGKSNYEIEHVFYGSSLANPYFETRSVSGGQIIAFKSDDKKTFFAQEIVPHIEASYFETFRPMFEFIRAKCAQSVVPKPSKGQKSATPQSSTRRR